MSLSVNSVFKVEPFKRDQLHVLGIQGEWIYTSCPTAYGCCKGRVHFVCGHKVEGARVNRAYIKLTRLTMEFFNVL